MNIAEAEKLYICNRAVDCLHSECLHNRSHKKDATCNWNDGPYVSDPQAIHCLGHYPLNALCCISCPPREIKTMSISDAEKRCKELNKQILAIYKESDFDSFAKHCGRVEAKPLTQELDGLLSAIIRAKDETKIEIEIGQ